LKTRRIQTSYLRYFRIHLSDRNAHCFVIPQERDCQINKAL